MAVQLFTNNAVSTIAGNLAISATTIDVAAGEGALFPTLTGGDWFNVTLESGANKEIVKVTARATDTFTIVRAQEGTSDQGWTLGDTIELRITNAWLATVHTSDSLPSPGDVVGPASATDSQLAAFDGTTGKLLKDSGVVVSGTNTGDQTLRIDSTLPFTDNTTGDVSTSTHGYVPKGTNVGSYLKDDGSWDIPEGVAMPEAVINGSMNIWQRGTAHPALPTTNFGADRYRLDSNTGVLDVDLVALSTAIHTASGQRLNNAMRVTVDTNDATVGTADFAMVVQPIEGYRALPYMHNEFTVSFYVRSSVAATHGFSVRNSGNDRAFVKNYTIDVINTWERKSITVPVQDQTGTWVYTNGVGMRLGWAFMSGTDFHGTDDTWNSANNIAALGIDNFLAVATDTWDLTGVQIDLGPTALAYRGIPFDQDLVAALRYYQKSYSYADVPGVAPETEGEESFRAIGTAHLFPIVLAVPMRAAPTFTAHNPNNVGNDWYDETAAGDVAVTFNVTGDKRTIVGVTSSVDTNQYSGHWEAESEL
jgi:hypothetical protein